MKAVLLLLVIAAFAGAEAAPLTLEAGAEKRGINHVIAVSASGDLADGDAVEFHLFYVRRWPIPPGLREAWWKRWAGFAPDPRSYDEELIDVDKGFAAAAGGTAGCDLSLSELPAWAGEYRVTAKAGTCELAHNFRIGNSAEFAAQRARVDRDVYEECARIRRIFDEFAGRWNRLGQGADAGWDAWRGTADARIRAIKERNGKRRKAEIYWMECRGKQRIDWMLQGLVPLLDTGGRHMTQPADKRAAPGEVQDLMVDFEADYDHYLAFLGIGRIVDPIKVGAALAKLQRVGEALDAWRKRLPADAAEWKKEQASVTADLLQGQMELSGELPEPWFGRAEGVSKSLLRLVDHVKSLAAGKEPAKPWDDLAKDFKKAVNDLDASVPRVDE